MITLKKTAEQLENEQKLEFLLDHDLIKDIFYKWFFDDTMLSEILTEDITNNDTKTVEALTEFLEDYEEEFEDWQKAQYKPEEREER